MYADKTVEFKYGDKTYGPYTVKDDPTAIPEDSEMGDDIAGVELFDGDKILFRGGVLHQGDNTLLFNEDGSLENIGFSAITSNGIEIDENGVAIDPMEPSISDILNLVSGPEITHKGEWFAWVGGVFICMVTAISILFADELFRFNLGFQIRNADRAEPSEWVTVGRYISWTILPVMAMILFIIGLR